MWQPNIGQMSTPIRVQSRTEIDINGMPDVNYQDIDPMVHFCNWKGKGGTEGIKNGTLTIEDTAELVMWYHPGINDAGRILRFKRSDESPRWNELIETFDGNDMSWVDDYPITEDYYSIYDIVNAENVEMRNQFLILKVRRVVNA